MGGGAAQDPGLRRLPLAAQDPPGVLPGRAGQPGLPALPRRREPDDGARRRDRLALRRRGGLRRLDPRRHRLRPVPRRRHHVARAGLRDDRGAGELLDLPRRGGDPVRGRHPRQPARRRRSGRARTAWTATTTTPPRTTTGPTRPPIAQKRARRCAPAATRRATRRRCGSTARCRTSSRATSTRSTARGCSRAAWWSPPPAPTATRRTARSRRPTRPRRCTTTTSPTTCGTCHRGIATTFAGSVHTPAEPDDRAPLPVLRGLPHLAHHRPHRSGRLPLRDDEPVRPLSRGGGRDLLRHLPRQGHQARRRGAAKCSDCHGTHGILPASDPASTLGRENVVATCGQCHEGSHRRFAGYLTHATHHDPEKYPWLFWSFWGMTALLVGTLSFALLHTLAWLVRLYLSRDEWRAPQGAGQDQLAQEALSALQPAAARHAPGDAAQLLHPGPHRA